jgi:tetratricopeptide (TPR) repeat protein
LPYSAGIIDGKSILNKMIGFTYKKPLSRAVLLFIGSVVMSACIQAPVRQPPAAPEPAKTAPEPAKTAPVAPSAEAPATPLPAPGGETLTAPVLYDMLLGEIAGQRGMMDVSGASYLEAARRSDDPRVAERALKISIYAKKPELALEAARRWVTLAPDNLEARQSLAVLALRTRNQDEALQQFEYLLQNAQEGTDPYQSLLALLAREPDTERSLQVMGELVAMRPENADAHFAYARLAVHAQDWALAELEVERALAFRADWTQALILQAQIDLKQGQGDTARRNLEAALNKHPEDTELRLAYARLLVDLDDFDAARVEYRKLLKLQPDNGQVVYSLALLTLEAGDLGEARKLFEKLVELEYQNRQAYYYLGAIAEEQQQPETAMQWYRRIEEGDHWLEVQIRMARLEAQAGDVEQARDRLRKVRLAHPAETQRMYLVEGEILSQIDRDEEAFRLYSDYLENRPDDIEIRYARALVAERLDRLDEAEQDFLHVLSIEPDNTRALNALGYTLADRTDRYEEALGYVQKALAQTPDDPAVIDSMGWVLYRLGRLEEARRYLQRAYDMTSDSEIAAHLGEVMWAMGDRDQAKALWNTARKATPDDRVLEETVRRYLR